MRGQRHIPRKNQPKYSPPPPPTHTHTRALNTDTSLLRTVVFVPGESFQYIFSKYSQNPLIRTLRPRICGHLICQLCAITNVNLSDFKIRKPKTLHLTACKCSECYGTPDRMNFRLIWQRSVRISQLNFLRILLNVSFLPKHASISFQVDKSLLKELHFLVKNHI